MGWKFWQKNEKNASATAPSGNKVQKHSKPRELPQDVGRHLVVVQNLDPDWAWSLKCVMQPGDNANDRFDIRIFSPETAALHGVTVRDYASLDNHMEVVIFQGSYSRNTRSVQLERLMKEAV